MPSDAGLMDLARKAGVVPEYTDMQNTQRTMGPQTARALLQALGFAVDSVDDIASGLARVLAEQTDRCLPFDVVITSDVAQAVPVRQPVEWLVLDETTGAVLAEGRTDDKITLPAINMGIHDLVIRTADTEQRSNLIAAPPRLPSLPEVTGQDRVWGVMAALFGLPSQHGNGLGDFEDLGELAAILGQKNAAFLGTNPVHSLGFAATEVISPYSPTHRGFLNTDHIAVGDGGQVPFSEQIDYAAHRRHHMAELKAAYNSDFKALSDSDRADFEAFCAHDAGLLQDFARYEYFSEKHGPDWRQWPDPLKDPKTAGGIPDAAAQFTKWLQWKADAQLGAAQAKARANGMALGLYLDLAVGARVGGAESWGGDNAAAPGVTLGAPPDHLSPAGQNWQLAALSPRKLQATKYRALRQVLRAVMRHCGLLRIDHALGLSRSFWVPEDGSPGGYVLQNTQALIAVIAIEAARAQTVVVGEDLGLVPKGFRETMASAGFYGYSVLQYEKDRKGAFLPAQKLRAQSLACFATHDTPTLAGFWEGRDIVWWEKLGWIEAKEAETAMKKRMSEKRQLLGVQAPQPVPPAATEGVRDTIHAALAASPAAMAAVQLDDILLQKEAVNLPGTVEEHPNWKRRLPLTLNEISSSPGLNKTAHIMARAGRAGKTREDNP